MKRETGCIAFLFFLFSLYCVSGCSAPVESETEKDKIVLNVLAGQSTSDAGVEDMIDEWMETHFPDIALEWECVDWGEQFNVQVQSRIAAGEVPDILIGKAQDVQNYAKNGNLGVISDDLAEKIQEEALAAVEVNGAVYGIPYTIWYQGVVYNKNIFRKYQLSPPETMDDLEEIVKVLQKEEIVAFASHFQESWKAANMSMQYMMNEVFKDDPDWGDQFRQGLAGFQTDERMRRSILNNQYILEHSWDDALQIDQFESDSRFTKGEAAMYLTGSWSMQFASEYGNEFEFGIFPFPNEKGDACLLQETNMTFMKSADTKYGKLVDEIFETIVTDENLSQEILNFTQSLSAIKDFDKKSTNALQDDIDYYEKNGRVIDVTTGNAQLIWPFQNSLGQQQQLWLKGEQTLDEVLQYADEHREDSAYFLLEE